MQKMKAVIYEKFGPPEVLRLTEVPKPVPGDNEVLVRVHAASVNAADCNIRGLTYIPRGLGLLARLMLGFNKPKASILGSVVAGEIESTGKNVQRFKIGERVYGTGPELGGYAEYSCRSESGAISKIPPDLSYEEAAAIPYGALTALYFLREKGKIRQGQKVLVNGASGGVGIFAVQLAHYFGAEVTGVCGTSNLEMVKSAGADRVIDYHKEDFTRSGEKWDIIMDIVVGKTSFSRARNSLNPGGFYLAVAGGLNEMMQMIWTSIKGGKKVIFGGGADCEKTEYLDFINELINSKKLKPFIDRSFSLEEIAEAHRYAETSHKKGSVVIAVK